MKHAYRLSFLMFFISIHTKLHHVHHLTADSVKRYFVISKIVTGKINLAELQ